MTLDQLPSVNPTTIPMRLKPAAERAVKRRHPWVFADGIREQKREGTSGDTAVIFDSKNRFLAAGLYDPASPIRVKLLVHHERTQIGPDLFRERLAAAQALRTPLLTTDTDAYRLVHGENDLLPGLIIDRYADTLVIKLYTAAWLPHMRDLLDALAAVQPAERRVLRLGRNIQREAPSGLVDGLILDGPPLAGPLTFHENGLTFSADVLHGHKTGFFFDQRDNRARVGVLAAGRDVLDVFAYSGGFSVYAAAGGAGSVLSVDVSQPALDAATANIRLNAHLPAVAACEHHTRAGDAFAIMRDLAREGRRFGLVIVDPPSFASSQDQISGALDAYRSLTRLALPLVSSGGTLVMASCSSRVLAADFFQLIEDTARQMGQPLAVLERTTHALDHPLLASFPEGAYLKCLYATKQG